MHTQEKISSPPLREKILLSIILNIFIVLSGYLYYMETAHALEAGWTISSPGSVAFDPVSWQVQSHHIEVRFPSNVEISNASSTTQGFLAQVKTTEPTVSGDPTRFISYSNVQVHTEAGFSQPDQQAGISEPRFNSVLAFSGSLATSNPITIMSADVRSRNAGTWSIRPNFHLVIPTKQKAGSYDATLTFELF